VVIITKSDTIVGKYMVATRSYFRDHFVLFLLTINVFLAIFTAIMVFLRLAESQGSGYIVQYRSNLGVNAFKAGSVTEIVGFGIFALIILAINLVMSFRTYKISRHVTISILGSGILLIALDIIVSNALFVLH
jgi:hypothetical protein